VPAVAVATGIEDGVFVPVIETALARSAAGA
jgi:hypothetical protein